VRKLLIAAFAHILALAFLVAGGAPAHAFGSESLGCVIDGGWPTYPDSNCYSQYTTPPNPQIRFSASNLSGSYSMLWTVTNQAGVYITSNCSATKTYNCIYSGCTVTSTTCNIATKVQAFDQTYTASLRLTQSGQNRTIQAKGWLTGTA
jgi:hypothetical protein